MAAPKEQKAAPEILTTFRPETASPDDVEHLIDFRVGQIDAQIREHIAAKEALELERKRWISVTGGRSRVNGEDT